MAENYEPFEIAQQQIKAACDKSAPNRLFTRF